MKLKYFLGAAPLMIGLSLTAHATPNGPMPSPAANTPDSPAYTTIKTTYTPIKVTPTRLLILTNLGSEFSPGEAHRLHSLMVSKLNACGVNAQYATGTPLMMSETVPVEFSQFAPDAILKLQPSIDASTNGITRYTGTLTAAATGKTVWNATLDVTPGVNVGEVTNRVVIDQLVIDSMLQKNCLVAAPAPQPS